MTIIEQQRDAALHALEITRKQAEDAHEAAQTMMYEARRAALEKSQIETEAKLTIEALQKHTNTVVAEVSAKAEQLVFEAGTTANSTREQELLSLKEEAEKRHALHALEHK